jgi:hypothetical protein
MKGKLFILLALLALFAVVAVRAENYQVTGTPSEFSLGSTQEMTLKVTNEKTSANNIVKIEISLPLDEHNVSYFDVKNLFTLPSGWQSSATVSEGKVTKIVFYSIGVGILPGSAQSFIFSSVTAPNKIGLYQFGWKITDSAGNVKSGSFPINVKIGPLTKFVLSQVPQEVVSGNPFNVTITAYSGDVVKADYTGTITFSSTDSTAKFTPSTYKFVPLDNGQKTITVVLYKTGNQTFTVKDDQAKVEVVSPIILVKPAVPRDLSISINGGASTTDSVFVTLSLSAVGAEECRYSNDKIFWSAYEPYTETKEWKLESGEGEKTVYYQCRNKNGESEIVSASITLTQGFVITLPVGMSITALIISIIALIIATRKGKSKKEE